MPYLICENITLEYDGRPAVDRLSMTVDPGDYLCIVGENGSGKSTLVAAMLGLKKPVSGSVNLSSDLKQTDIGYLPQQTNIQRDFPAGVFEVVLSGCLDNESFMPCYRARDRQKALENMEKLRISHLKNQSYNELSGGQQQRVLLARTLCAAKKMLILDEPVSGLDPVVSGELYRLIRTINRDMKMTVIMVSHDVKSAVEHATKILHLDRHPLFFGKTEDYIESEAGRRFLEGGKGNV